MRRGETRGRAHEAASVLEEEHETGGATLVDESQPVLGSEDHDGRGESVGLEGARRHDRGLKDAARRLACPRVENVTGPLVSSRCADGGDHPKRGPWTVVSGGVVEVDRQGFAEDGESAPPEIDEAARRPGRSKHRQSQIRGVALGEPIQDEPGPGREMNPPRRNVEAHVLVAHAGEKSAPLFRVQRTCRLAETSGRSHKGLHRRIKGPVRGRSHGERVPNDLERLHGNDTVTGAVEARELRLLPERHTLVDPGQGGEGGVEGGRRLGEAAYGAEDDALTRQYRELLRTEGLEIEFTDGAVREIARIAVEVNSTTENIGARRLFTLAERVLEEVSFEGPALKGKKIEVDREYVRQRVQDLIEDRDLGKYVL